MKKLPEIASKAWDNRQDAVIFSTVSADGLPNSIYATSVTKHNENSIVVANNFFKKTMENIRSGSTGSILFITKDNEMESCPATRTWSCRYSHRRSIRRSRETAINIGNYKYKALNHDKLWTHSLPPVRQKPWDK